MLTAKDGEWDQVEGLDTGADDFLTKPFSFPVLVARLRAVTRRGAGECPPDQACSTNVDRSFSRQACIRSACPAENMNMATSST